MKTLRAKIETAFADFLSANIAGTSASGLPVYPGDNEGDMEKPRIVAMCNQAQPEGGPLEGLGNYNATVSVWVEHDAHATTADDHRICAEAVKRLLIRDSAPTVSQAMASAGVMPYEVVFDGDDMRRENDSFVSVFAFRVPCVDNPEP